MSGRTRVAPKKKMIMHSMKMGILIISYFVVERVDFFSDNMLHIIQRGHCCHTAVLNFQLRRHVMTGLCTSPSRSR